MPDTQPRMTVTGFPCVLQMKASQHAGAERDRAGDRPRCRLTTFGLQFKGAGPISR
jgi:hypothetical protein